MGLSDFPYNTLFSYTNLDRETKCDRSHDHITGALVPFKFKYTWFLDGDLITLTIVTNFSLALFILEVQRNYWDVVIYKHLLDCTISDFYTIVIPWKEIKVDAGSKIE